MNNAHRGGKRRKGDIREEGVCICIRDIEKNMYVEHAEERSWRKGMQKCRGIEDGNSGGVCTRSISLQGTSRSD